MTTTRAARAAEEWFKDQFENGVWIERHLRSDGESYALSYQEAYEAGVRFAVEEVKKKEWWTEAENELVVKVGDLEALLKAEGDTKMTEEESK